MSERKSVSRRCSASVLSSCWNWTSNLLDFEKSDVRPRFFFDTMIWSNSLMDGSSGRLVSRSWMNSLKADRR